LCVCACVCVRACVWGGGGKRGGGGGEGDGVIEREGGNKIKSDIKKAKQTVVMVGEIDTQHSV
jgi:hypothetical protein